MNTKIIMTLSALVLGATGIVLSFTPDLIAMEIAPGAGKTAELLIQIIGGLYFGFAMLNWMAKGALIGGIYNRPIAVANLTHYIISGMAIVKFLNTINGASMILWFLGIIYVILGIAFGLILFRHPLKAKEA